MAAGAWVLESVVFSTRGSSETACGLAEPASPEAAPASPQHGRRRLSKALQGPVHINHLAPGTPKQASSPPHLSCKRHLSGYSGHSLLSLPSLCQPQVWSPLLPSLSLSLSLPLSSFLPSLRPLTQNKGFLLAQLVKNPSAMQETWVQSLGWEDPPETGKATHSSILAQGLYSPWGRRVGHN